MNSGDPTESIASSGDCYPKQREPLAYGPTTPCSGTRYCDQSTVLASFLQPPRLSAWFALATEHSVPSGLGWPQSRLAQGHTHNIHIKPATAGVRPLSPRLAALLIISNSRVVTLVYNPILRLRGYANADLFVAKGKKCKPIGLHQQQQLHGIEQCSTAA